MTHNNRYRNPWAKLCNTPRPEFYENNARLVLEHRGVSVYKLSEHSYDFVFGGVCIAQRAGVTEARASIDKLLTGDDPCASTVADHLKAAGFAAMSYEDYSAAVMAGTRE